MKDGEQSATSNEPEESLWYQFDEEDEDMMFCFEEASKASGVTDDCLPEIRDVFLELIAEHHHYETIL